MPVPMACRVCMAMADACGLKHEKQACFMSMSTSRSCVCILCCASPPLAAKPAAAEAEAKDTIAQAAVVAKGAAEEKAAEAATAAAEARAAAAANPGDSALAAKAAAAVAEAARFDSVGLKCEQFCALFIFLGSRSGGRRLYFSSTIPIHWGAC